MNPTETCAELAKSFISPSNYDEETDTYNLPNGWLFLGAGAYRTALLAPDGFVYKVQHNTDSNWQENTMEWDQFQMWGAEVKAISNGVVHLAKCIEFFTDSNVLVMEYEPCAANVMWFDFCWEERWCDVEVEKIVNSIINVTEITDLHSGNMYFNTRGEVVIVDYTH